MSDTASEISCNSSRDASTDDEHQSEEEMEISNQIQPYENEPLASGEEQEESEEEADIDRLTPDMLSRRYEREVEVREWCRCGKCCDENLVGALDFRCCFEVKHAIGMLCFDGSIERVNCITEHEDYSAMTNKTVLLQVAPLLRGKDGQVYRKRNGVSQNDLLRAVAYRWIVRWLCGYMGWDNCRPLPACVYHDIRNKFKTTQDSTGYMTSQDRE